MIFIWIECNCDSEGSDGLDCNYHGICTCLPHITGDKCDQCKENMINFPLCECAPGFTMIEDSCHGKFI